MTLRAVTFPIYAAEGWPARIVGSGSHGDLLTEIRISHDDSPDADPFAGDRHRLEVTTATDEFQLADEVRHARETLQDWIANHDPPGSWPDASHAAVTLWLAARDRKCRGMVLSAARTEQTVIIDGTAQPFLTLTASTGSWVAVRAHHDLMITIAGHDLDPSALTIEPIASPVARLLGPRPQDP
jgi:hypothetical protein